MRVKRGVSCGSDHYLVAKFFCPGRATTTYCIPLLHTPALRKENGNWLQSKKEKEKRRLFGTIFQLNEAEIEYNENDIAEKEEVIRAVTRREVEREIKN